MSKPLPPREYFTRRYYYEPTSGELWHRRDNSTARIGDVAGALTNQGYVQIGVPGFGFYRAHRVVWYMCTGEDPGEKMVDHINGQRDDNRIENLRLTCAWGNGQNRKGEQIGTYRHMYT